MRTLLFGLLLAMLTQTARAQDTDEAKADVTPSEQIAKLIADGLPDEAAKALSVAELEDSERTRFRSQIMTAYLRKGEWGAATDIAKEDFYQSLESSPDTSLNYLRMMAAYAPRAEKTGEAIEAADRAIEVFARVVKEGEYSDALAKEFQAAAIKVALLSGTGDQDGAKSLAGTYVDRAQVMLANKPASKDVLFLTVDAITTASQLAEGEEREAMFNQASQLLVSELDKDEIDETLVQRYAQLVQMEVTNTFRDNPERAESLINTAKEQLDAALVKNADVEDAVKRFERGSGSILGRIESAKILAKLVGSPAPPIDAQVWVNGDGMSAESLEGKVVLLDFWAVWCGPCIATFPHLQEWNEEFGSKGLQIVGVTRKYGYAWNDETERASRAEEENTLEQEVEMLQKFLAHHELQHPSIVTPQESEMQSQYAVSGIPHAVLIDRKGVVRMIKVGSGEANAKALHDMIVELLAE